ncbi:sodium- and chloride-dependent GABA transporter 2-like isoform X2 [Tachypleus tridentatus]|uniref:sodium- and chloride-dependent GABA transporter 2-like isoform X2 n=1 Tax=Tachypleus tridentatus TaxID=6853 RepID=UPI003FD340C0
MSYATAILLIMTSVYYMTVISWALCYLFTSMNESLPWSVCPDDVPSLSCSVKCTLFQYGCDDYKNYTTKRDNLTNSSNKWLPSEHYFNDNIVRSAAGLFQNGGISWQLFLCLVFAWMVVYISIRKGKISIQRTSLFPTVIVILVLMVLLGTSASHSGFRRGLDTYLTFKWKTLNNPEIWHDSTTQVVLSLGIGSGVVQILGRRSCLSFPILEDTMVVILVNGLIAFFSGVVVFGCLGVVAEAMNKENVLVLREELGVSFVSLSAALSLLPGAVLWSLVFFVFLVWASFSRQDVIVLSLAASLIEHLNIPWLKRHRATYLFIVCLVLFCLGLLLATEGGIHLLAIIDKYAIGWPALIICLLECGGIMWLYGASNFFDDTYNLNERHARMWRYIWKVVTPFVMLIVLLYTLFGHKQTLGHDNHHRRLSLIIGWILFITVIAAIPICAVYLLATKVLSKQADRKNLKCLLRSPLVESYLERCQSSKDKNCTQQTGLSAQIIVVRVKNSPDSTAVPIPYGYMVAPPAKIRKCLQFRRNRSYLTNDESDVTSDVTKRTEINHLGSKNTDGSQQEDITQAEVYNPPQPSNNCPNDNKLQVPKLLTPPSRRDKVSHSPCLGLQSYSLASSYSSLLDELGDVPEGPSIFFQVPTISISEPTPTKVLHCENSQEITIQEEHASAQVNTDEEEMVNLSSTPDHRLPAENESLCNAQSDESPLKRSISNLSLALMEDQEDNLEISVFKHASKLNLKASNQFHLKVPLPNISISRPVSPSPGQKEPIRQAFSQPPSPLCSNKCFFPDEMFNFTSSDVLKKVKCSVPGDNSSSLKTLPNSLINSRSSSYNILVVPSNSSQPNGLDNAGFESS